MRFTSVASARSEARALRVQPGPGYPSGSPGPLSQIETSATSFGMVGERAKVLGRLGGSMPSPHPRARALSCPSLVIYGPGSLGHLTRPASRC